MSEEIFLSRLSENQLTIYEFLHSSFMDFPGVSTKIRYKIPFYDYHSWLAYINPVKSGGLELCFVRGKELSSHGTMLHSRDRKQIAGLIIDDLNKAPIDDIMDAFAEAIVLDDKSHKKIRN